ncbi:MAG TPA: transglycosylase SLT domain-containing protein [Nitrospiraceae bacterium]|jgi:membrane-bound lytic murein transglycosylase D|nr:transglycosylase SLT domain-containing protein [Nitrospiraceae bacterium]
MKGFAVMFLPLMVLTAVALATLATAEQSLVEASAVQTPASGEESSSSTTLDIALQAVDETPGPAEASERFFLSDPPADQAERESVSAVEKTARPPQATDSEGSKSEGSAKASEEEENGHVTYNVPIVLDSSVQSHIRYFNTAIRDRFEKWLLRLGKYKPLVERIFSEFDLPSDLVYLSLVESGFNPHAYSRARATGPWQFMKGTAKLYGLRVDQYVDERRDPIKSTVAAARYLKDLYDLFGSWPLAMAAYNAGEGKVLRALQKAQAESFKEISRTTLIRRETKEYVPRFMAATIIAKNPDRYGFPLEEVTPHRFEEVVVRRPIHFRAISNVTGIPYQELKNLNPELRRDATPPDDAEYHLKVPAGMKEKVERLLDRIPTYKHAPIIAKSKRNRIDFESAKVYRVRVGDTLEKIAKRFRISVKALKVRNNLTSALIKPGDVLAIR